MRLETQIFATRADLVPGIARLEEQIELRYARCESYESAEPAVLESLLDASVLGTSEFGDRAKDALYLVSPATLPIQTRRVLQRDGGYRFVLDQQENPGSIVIRPGGLFGADILVAGMVGTIWPDSKSLYDRFVRTMTKGFRRIRSYQVGPEAASLLERGWRLVTMSAREPREYDLKA